MLLVNKRCWAALFLALSTPAVAQEVLLVVQSSPLAGFDYNEAATHWEAMKVGDALSLVREPDNSHDSKAIRVEWQGYKLGYVPRSENDAVAWAMDRGQRLSARISQLKQDQNPRRRIEFEVYVESADAPLPASALP